jgi:hypothetical protein
VVFSRYATALGRRPSVAALLFVEAVAAVLALELVFVLAIARPS